MQQLAAQGVSETRALINRMVGYVPDLHTVWVSTSDQQLMALSTEFPGFYRYAFLMEEAFDAERSKASRPYDRVSEFSEAHKQQAAQLLATAATLEHFNPARTGPVYPQKHGSVADDLRYGPPTDAALICATK